ncbi:MAG: methyltransferase [Rhodospirillaceae bacterium]|nr:methyltransferase [Rhodospirillaceae bacterium]
MIKRKINEFLTLTGLRSKGIFIPHRYIKSFKTRKYRYLEKFFNKYFHNMILNIQSITEYEDNLIDLSTTFEPEPRWNQDWFPRLDAASTYFMIRKNKPKKIIEIGSGHSSRFLSKGIVDNKIKCDLVCIDPKPRANIKNLPFINHIELKIQDLNIDNFSFDQIDILFIDSSHILMPGSDVDIIFNHIIPKLKIGALVHVHDIFLPDNYPNSWSWRNYNEQTLVATLLLSDRWSIEWASNYIKSYLYKEIEKTFLHRLPLLNNAFESSLWIKKL